MLNACTAVDDPRASAANDYAMRRVNLLFSSPFRVAVALAKRSAIKRSAEDEMNRE